MASDLNPGIHADFAQIVTVGATATFAEFLYSNAPPAKTPRR